MTSPHGDDGLPVRAARGRPGKPPLTDEEFEAVKGILTLPRGTHGSSLDRAALEISLMRGLHKASDPRTRKAREVSARWLTRELAKRGIPGKNGMRAKFGITPKKHQPRRKSNAAVDTGSRVTPESPAGGKP